jgi:sulfatase maturation enzyme AslB (radical SAM superfamily)
MCNPELSTNWYADAKKLGKEFFPPIKSGIIRSTELLEEYDLSQLRYLKLIGGEPLMEQDKFIKLLKRCDRSKLKILLTTNSTIIPNEELVTLLKECETVWVNLSIDTYGPLNDFLRKGSKWENVVKVLDWFANTFPGKTKVHSIISIYNINNFYLLEEFINKTYPKKVKSEWQMVDGPDWMQPANLPVPVKSKILEDLKSKVSNNVFSMCQEELDKTGNYNLFLSKDSKLNEVRNENWHDLNIELANLLT